MPYYLTASFLPHNWKGFKERFGMMVEMLKGGELNGLEFGKKKNYGRGTRGGARKWWMGRPQSRSLEVGI